MIPVEKLQTLARRYEEIEQLMCEPDVLADQTRITSLNRERSHLGPVLDAFSEWRDVDKRIREDREALDDPELGPLVREELPELEERMGELEHVRPLPSLRLDPSWRRLRKRSADWLRS